MRKDDFLNELERLLKDIPEGDRMDAIEYYYDYFDEAGVENEQKVIRELGSPERVAQTIKENLGVSGYDESRDYGKRGDYSESRDCSEPENYGEPGDYSKSEDYNTGDVDVHRNTSSTAQSGNSDKKTSWILIGIIAVLTFPLWIGIVAGLFGGLIGLIAGTFGVVIGLLASGFGLAVGGLACFGAGIVQLSVTQFEGLAVMGVGAILTSIGFLMILLLVWLVGTWIPALVKLIINACDKLFHRS